tara:strand:- start:6949 stop:7878 length:930 start_codon:yes stop_codon:yes gene_type:complete
MQKTITLIGFGNQAKAWAMNLRDSGWSVKIALKPDSLSKEIATSMGFESLTLEQASQSVGNFANLTPDHLHHEVLENIKFKPRSRLIFAHGYSVESALVSPAKLGANALLFAPKAIASELRFLYETKGKLGAVYSVEFSPNPEDDKAWLLDLAKGLGINAGPYPTSFEHETKADLFSEQSILCSVLPRAAERSFQLLRDKGISEELAYLECWYEMKLIANTLVKMGPSSFFKLISPNALLGGYEADKLLFDKAYQNKLETLFERIDRGTFYKQAKETDFQLLRQTIENDWGQCELEKTHQRLKSELFGD